MMDDFIEFFQICHQIDQSLCEQCRCDATDRNEHKEANQNIDASDKWYAA